MFTHERDRMRERRNVGQLLPVQLELEPAARYVPCLGVKLTPFVLSAPTNRDPGQGLWDFLELYFVSCLSAVDFLLICGLSFPLLSAFFWIN